MTELTDEQIMVCNCVGCSKEILGLTMKGVPKNQLPKRYRGMKTVAGRIDGRPYCPDCLRPDEHNRRDHVRDRGQHEPSPMYENVVRIMTDGY